MDWKPSNQLSLIWLLIAHSSAYAVIPQHNVSFPSGFIVGAGLGITSFMTNTTFNALAVSTQNSERNIQNTTMGTLGNLAVGYGKNLNNIYYLGGELGLNILGARRTVLHNLNQNNTVVTDDTAIARINQSLSTTIQVTENTIVPVLDIKPGLFFGSNTLVFARLGMSVNTIALNMKSSYQSSGMVERSNNPPSASASSSFSNLTNQSTIGFRSGLGFEYLITDNLGLSANYIFTGYKKVQLNGSKASSQIACDTFEGCSVNQNGTYIASSNSKVSVQDVMLQLIYHMA